MFHVELLNISESAAAALEVHPFRFGTIVMAHRFRPGVIEVAHRFRAGGIECDIPGASTQN